MAHMQFHRAISGQGIERFKQLDLFVYTTIWTLFLRRLLSQLRGTPISNKHRHVPVCLTII